MPVGRDAATVAGLIERADLRSVICNTAQEAVDSLERIVEVVLVVNRRPRLTPSWLVKSIA
jgi:hypothetical protein